MRVETRANSRPGRAPSAAKNRESRARRLLKQSAAAAVLIIGILLINRSSFAFGKNCVAALGRAVNHNFDWMGILYRVRDYFMTVWRFWSEVF